MGASDMNAHIRALYDRAGQCCCIGHVQKHIYWARELCGVEGDDLWVFIQEAEEVVEFAEAMIARAQPYGLRSENRVREHILALELEEAFRLIAWLELRNPSGKRQRKINKGYWLVEKDGDLPPPPADAKYPEAA